MKTMKAAMFRGNGVLNIEEIPVPEIQKDTEVKLKIKAAGICGSDLHALSVPPLQKISSDIVLGHEFYGEIVEKGSAVRDFDIGDYAVVQPAISCGTCFECRHQMEFLCSNKLHYGQSLDGGFAQYAVVDVGQLYPVPREANPDRAAQTEPLACIMDALKKIDFTADSRVILMGAGPIGLTFIRTLKYLGIRNLMVSAKGKARIQQARDCGADVVVDVQRECVRDVMQREWDRKADIVIDAVGSGEVLSQSMELLGSRGQVLVFGYNLLAEAVVRPGLICGNEFKIVGALGKDFESALKIVDDPALGLDKLVTRRIALEDLNEAIEDLRNKKACRIIVYPNGQ